MNTFHTIPTMTSLATTLPTLAFPGVHTNPSQHIGARLADAPHCCARPPSPAQLLGSIAPVMAGKVGIGTGKVGIGTGKVGEETGDVIIVDADGAGGGTPISPASCSAMSSGVQHLMCRLPPDRLLHSSPSLHIFKFLAVAKKGRSEDTARVVLGSP